MSNLCKFAKKNTYYALCVYSPLWFVKQLKCLGVYIYVCTGVNLEYY